MQFVRFMYTIPTYFVIRQNGKILICTFQINILDLNFTKLTGKVLVCIEKFFKKSCST